MNVLGRVIRSLRPLVYKVGFRPKLGSVWHSPSLSWKLAMHKAIEQTAKQLRRK